MSSIAKLTLQGFTFGAALTAGGCMPQNQNELEQMRAELATLKAEVAALKANEAPSGTTASSAVPVAPEAGATPQAEGTSVPKTATTEDWTAALEQHENEKRDAEWARLREPALFEVAKDHIKEYGASLNSVRCKATSCLLTINVPKKPKQAYEPMSNPWAEVTMLAHAKPIYSGRTLWSYLLPRHERDTATAADGRVNPVEVARATPERAGTTVVVGSEAGASTTASAPAEKAASGAAASPGAASKGAAPGSAAAPSPPATQAPVASGAKPATASTSTAASKGTAASQTASAAPQAAKPAEKSPAAAPQAPAAQRDPAAKPGTTTPVSAQKSGATPSTAPTGAPQPKAP